jgi:hypothetical protein
MTEVVFLPPLRYQRLRGVILNIIASNGCRPTSLPRLYREAQRVLGMGWGLGYQRVSRIVWELVQEGVIDHIAEKGFVSTTCLDREREVVRMVME